ETYGQYAYVVNERGPMQIVSLADPTRPVVVGQLNTQPGVAQGGQHTHSIVGDRLYVHGGRSPGGIRVYSLANPVAPVLLGAYQPFYVHDIGVHGTTLYAAAIYGEGIDIVDASNPAAMTRRGLFNYPGSGAHNVCLTTDGRYAFVGDEIGTSGKWTRIFDVQDPNNVEMVGQIIVDGAAVVHNCYVRGNRLFLAHYTEGLRVFDITAPRTPVEVAFYDTYPGAGYGYNGAWAVYPYLPSGRILVSDRTGGISVVRLTSPVSGEAGVSDALGPVTVGPNPVRDMARVHFETAAPASARVSVVDVLGREVVVLADGRRAAGRQTEALDGRALPPGVYLVRVAVDGQAQQSALVTVAR
ncbi:MAG TPA: choice-of-anchor B family protein, partial [Rubricoccaceae bacterium]